MLALPEQSLSPASPVSPADANPQRRGRRVWSNSEDGILKELVIQYGDGRGPSGRWKEISAALPGRTAKDCRKRWFHSLDPSLRKGRWTELEDRTLLDAYAKLGPAWHDIALLIPGRKDDQCAKRYTDILDPSARNRLCSWTRREDELLRECVERLGHRWSSISSHFESRPPLTCRNRWRHLCRQGERSATSENDVSPGSTCSSFDTSREQSTISTSGATSNSTAHYTQLKHVDTPGTYRDQTCHGALEGLDFFLGEFDKDYFDLFAANYPASTDGVDLPAVDRQDVGAWGMSIEEQHVDHLRDMQDGAEADVTSYEGGVNSTIPPPAPSSAMTDAIHVFSHDTTHEPPLPGPIQVGNPSHRMLNRPAVTQQYCANMTADSHFVSNLPPSTYEDLGAGHERPHMQRSHKRQSKLNVHHHHHHYHHHYHHHIHRTVTPGSGNSTAVVHLPSDSHQTGPTQVQHPAA